MTVKAYSLRPLMLQTSSFFSPPLTQGSLLVFSRRKTRRAVEVFAAECHVTSNDSPDVFRDDLSRLDLEALQLSNRGRHG